MRKNMHKPPKRSNFAIRKLTIGAAAVLLVGPLIGASTQTVHASQSTTQIEQQPLAQMHPQLIMTHLNVMPDAAEGIANLPEGATAEWIIKPNVTQPGRTTGVVLVTQRGHWPRTFTVPVDVSGEHVKKDNEKYDPEVHQNLSTKVKEPFAASTTVANLDKLPQGTEISWAIEPNWEQAGNYSAQIQVTYPDKSIDIATVQVEVKEILLSENYQPQVKDLVTTVGKEVSATDAVTNAAHLPEGTTITWKKEPDVSKAGPTTGIVLVTYKDDSTDEV